MNAPFAGLSRPMRSAPFRGLWTSLLLSGLGDWAARIALAILVLDRTHSAALPSLVMAASFLPWLGPGQVLATRLGHLPRIRVMVAADLVRAAIFAILLIHLPTWGLFVLVFVAATATPPFEAARSALTVETVPAEDYGAAVALLDMTDQSAIIVGYLIGGVSVLVGGVSVALVVNVASFLLSAAVLARVHEHHVARPAESVHAQLRRGVEIVVSEPVLRRGMLTLLVAALPVAAVESTAAVYARWVLHAHADVAGLLAAAVAVGIMLAVPFVPKSGSARHLLRAGAAVAVIGSLVAGVAFGVGGPAGAVVGYLAAGVLSGSATPAQIAFQPRIATRDRPGVYSVAQMLVMGGQAVGAAIGGLLAASVGSRQADIGWMGLVLAISAVAFLVPTRDHADAPVATGSPALEPMPAVEPIRSPAPVIDPSPASFPVSPGRPWVAAASPRPATRPAPPAAPGPSRRSPSSRPRPLRPVRTTRPQSLYASAGAPGARPWRCAVTPWPVSRRRGVGPTPERLIVDLIAEDSDAGGVALRAGSPVVDAAAHNGRTGRAVTVGR